MSKAQNGIVHDEDEVYVKFFRLPSFSLHDSAPECESDVWIEVRAVSPAESGFTVALPRPPDAHWARASLGHGALSLSSLLLLFFFSLPPSSSSAWMALLDFFRVPFPVVAADLFPFSASLPVLWSRSSSTCPRLVTVVEAVPGWTSAMESELGMLVSSTVLEVEELAGPKNQF